MLEVYITTHETYHISEAGIVYPKWEYGLFTAIAKEMREQGVGNITVEPHRDQLDYKGDPLSKDLARLRISSDPGNCLNSFWGIVAETQECYRQYVRRDPHTGQLCNPTENELVNIRNEIHRVVKKHHPK